MNCEPTYEELKQILWKEGLERAWNCEPTYEELKPDREVEVVGEGIPIASLPMRNWNLP